MKGSLVSRGLFFIQVKNEKLIWKPIYELAKEAAESDFKSKDTIINKLKIFINDHLVDYDNTNVISISESARVWVSTT